MADKIRVQVIISMDIDRAGYEAAYGAKSVREIRDDIQWSAFNAVAQTTLPMDEQDRMISNVVLLNAASQR